MNAGDVRAPVAGGGRRHGRGVPCRLARYDDDYGELAATTLRGMWTRAENRPAVTLAAWLLPIVPAALVPLWATRLPLAVLAVAIALVGVGSLLGGTERREFATFLSQSPEAGYMWHEVLLVTLCAFLVAPTHFFRLFGTPGTCVCVGPVRTTRLPPALFVALACASAATVLPTVAPLVDAETGEFFLLGYSTQSVYASALSVAMILVWVRTYHLVVHDALQVVAGRGRSRCARAAAILYGLLTTALVEVWVCAAFALHLAASSAFALEDEADDPLEEWVSRTRVVRWTSALLSRVGRR